MKILSSKEKEVIEILRNISGENVERISNVLMALMLYSILQYVNGEETIIPYFGKYLIRYKGDETTNEGLEAVLDILMLPSDYLKQNIGKYEDYKSGKLKNLLEVPIMDYFMKMNVNTLKQILNDEIVKEEE